MKMLRQFTEQVSLNEGCNHSLLRKWESAVELMQKRMKFDDGTGHQKRTAFYEKKYVNAFCKQLETTKQMMQRKQTEIETNIVNEDEDHVLIADEDSKKEELSDTAAARET